MKNKVVFVIWWQVYKCKYNDDTANRELNVCSSMLPNGLSYCSPHTSLFILLVKSLMKFDISLKHVLATKAIWNHPTSFHQVPVAIHLLCGLGMTWWDACYRIKKSASSLHQWQNTVVWSFLIGAFLRHFYFYWWTMEQIDIELVKIILHNHIKNVEWTE